MDNLPANVAAWLRELAFSERAVAYLKIASDLNLVDAGGNLDQYGLADLQAGAPVLEQVYVLEGLLPLEESPYFVPEIEFLSGCSANLHFHQDGDAVWLILLDVTAERDSARRMQQKAYDMTLLQEREALLNRRLEEANAALLAAQDELKASRDAARDALLRKQVELNEARTLQLALAPPPFEGRVGNRTLNVDVVLEPAKEVGGDLVDHFCIDGDLLVLVLGDVSDKGAGAALMMARTHALFRGIAARPDASQLFRAPEQAVRLVNATLSDGNLSCMFVTLLIATFDAATNRLTYVRAGHVPPFLRRATGAVERLEAAGGPPLGIMEEAKFKSAVVDLGTADELLIVTDGITEAMDPSQELFGDARVTALAGQRDPGQGTLLDQLLTQVRAFEAGQPQSDDIAAILLRLGAE